MEGITYYRLKSPYDGDVTKNCALTGNEVDNNFYTLEGRDIQSLTVNGDDIIITLLNGKQIVSKDALNSDYVSNIEFDKINGVLKVTQNGITTEITGFATDYNIGNTVAVDGSLVGNGLPSKPVGMSPLSKTGQYKPVKKIVDITNGEKLPQCCEVALGERFLTKEDVSNYGYLYNYNGVKQIVCALKAENSAWRIPTKEDWDDMLNAIEPCDADRNHSSATANKYLGRWAGKLLKSTDLWKTEGGCCCDACGNKVATDGCGCGTTDCNCENDNTTCINYDDCACLDTNACANCDCSNNTNTCSPTYCGESENCPCKVECNNAGLDKYGFRVTPAGYADDGCNYLYFRERACFWTATNSKCTSAYTKRFEYNKSTVHQDVEASQYYFSLRLVKDYNGENFNEREDILGSPISTVLMPSVKNGHAIWTSVNLALGNKEFGAIMPNDGQGLTFITHYFINEWNGQKWLRSEIKEGESVVAKSAPNDKVDREYRVINNVLTSVDEIVYKDVLESVGENLDELGQKLDAEIERSTTRDDALDERLTTAEGKIEELVTKTDETNTHLSTVEKTLSDFGKETAKAIETLNQNLVDSINTINGGIEAERQIRAEKDTELENRINADEAALEAEKTRVDSMINQLNTNISEGFNTINEAIGQTNANLNAETEQRKEADETLQNNIDTVSNDLETLQEKVKNIEESSTAQFDDLKAALENETNERKAKDTEIEDKLPTAEGTEFNETTGVLTIKSVGGTNDISIKFSGNFGTF